MCWWMLVSYKCRFQACLKACAAIWGCWVIHFGSNSSESWPCKGISQRRSGTSRYSAIVWGGHEKILLFFKQHMGILGSRLARCTGLLLLMLVAVCVMGYCLQEGCHGWKHQPGKWPGMFYIDKCPRDVGYMIILIFRYLHNLYIYIYKYYKLTLMRCQMLFDRLIYRCNHQLCDV